MRIFLPRDARSASAVLLSQVVRPSVCPSLRDVDPGLGWSSSKLITRIISLGSSLLEPQHRYSSPKGTPLKFGWNRGGVAFSGNLQYL